MGASFSLSVLYSTLAVFAADLDRPFNDWTNVHVAQGFTWRPGSVSFATLEEGGTLQVEVEAATDIQVKETAQRAILVPFTVDVGQLVEVATIVEGRQLQLPQGRYGLLYETGHNPDGGMWCCLTFVPGDHEARLLHVDDELQPPARLLMDAQAAG